MAEEAEWTSAPTPQPVARPTDGHEPLMGPLPRGRRHVDDVVAARLESLVRDEAARRAVGRDIRTRRR